MRILLISNGHGEDRIALNLAREWQAQSAEVEFQALALVGTGLAYRQAQIPLLHAGFELPSQGFAYLHPLKLWQDLRAGLPRHLYQSWKQLKQARFEGVIAVGDIVSLWAARQCACPYVFVACALSDYYLGENSPRTSFDPVQLYCLRQDKARVYARDALTDQNLKARGVDSLFLGNPMLESSQQDRVSSSAKPTFYPLSQQDNAQRARLQLVFLPGSHVDAAQNLKDILWYCHPFLSQNPCLIFLPIPGAALKQACREVLLRAAWQAVKTGPERQVELWQHQTNRLMLLDAEAYPLALDRADIAIGLSGTANEQAVARGVPVLSFDGRGLQYTPSFAEAQQRLLGPGLNYMGPPHPQLISWQLNHMRQHLALYKKQAQKSAQQRFGEAGAVERIVKDLRSFLRD